MLLILFGFFLLPIHENRISEELVEEGRSWKGLWILVDEWLWSGAGGEYFDFYAKWDLATLELKSKEVKFCI